MLHVNEQRDVSKSKVQDQTEHRQKSMTGKTTSKDNCRNFGKFFTFNLHHVDVDGDLSDNNMMTIFWIFYNDLVTMVL